jgi:AcrR family transcriptional regulator
MIVPVKGVSSVHNDQVVERWTPERRRQHTRDVLLDAAEEVFAHRGYEGASLEEIAEAAGYSRGTIYKTFGSKEELFLAAGYRFNERFLATFASTAGTDPSSMDLAAVVEHWRQVRPEPRDLALGLEFQLYLLRNPDARSRAAPQREKLAEMVASFIEEQAAQLGVHWRIPTLTVARLVLATTDGLYLAAYLDGSSDDLYVPFLEALLSLWDQSRETPPPTMRRGSRKVIPRSVPKQSRARGVR